MGKKALLANTAIYRTFTISKVNLNLQFFYLIELWHSTKNWIYTNLLCKYGAKKYCCSMLSCLKLTNVHTVSGRPTLKNDSGRLKKAKLRTFARKQILCKPIKKLVKK